MKELNGRVRLIISSPCYHCLLHPCIHSYAITQQLQLYLIFMTAVDSTCALHLKAELLSLGSNNVTCCSLIQVVILDGENRPVRPSVFLALMRLLPEEFEC
jgi:hypothetical protein